MGGTSLICTCFIGRLLLHWKIFTVGKISIFTHTWNIIKNHQYLFLGVWHSLNSCTYCLYPMWFEYYVRFVLSLCADGTIDVQLSQHVIIYSMVSFHVSVL